MLDWDDAPAPAAPQAPAARNDVQSTPSYAAHAAVVMNNPKQDPLFAEGGVKRTTRKNGKPKTRLVGDVAFETARQRAAAVAARAVQRGHEVSWVAARHLRPAEARHAVGDPAQSRPGAALRAAAGRGSRGRAGQ